MNGPSANSFANRDETLPVLVVSGSEEVSSEAEATGGKRQRVRNKLSATRLREKVQDASEKRASSSNSLQDRLFAKLLQQVIPSEDIDDDQGPADIRSTKYIDRPGFSLPLMTRNFRRFNSRVGVVFVFQTRVLRLVTWRVPSHTLSFLAIYTFICLNPYLLGVLPLALILLGVMVPSFIIRHPPPPTNAPTDTYSAHGPATAPAPSVKPVAEMSKDFFRNLRDLQNSMDDFARIHDKIISFLAPPTNFSNEALSSAIFLYLFASACTMFVASHLLPWRLMFFSAGWIGTCLGHPSIQKAFTSVHEDHVHPRELQAKDWLSTWIENDILLDGELESREVEIFELQRRRGSTEWEGWIFSPSAHDPLSPERISGDRPKGTRFFEDVQPPRGWEWSDKKWTLDLQSREWVEERMITGVEIETEGERWVYDILYDDSDVEEGTATQKGKDKRREWEEGTGKGKTGIWRRRRWVRMVKRRSSTAKLEKPA